MYSFRILFLVALCSLLLGASQAYRLNLTELVRARRASPTETGDLDYMKFAPTMGKRNYDYNGFGYRDGSAEVIDPETMRRINREIFMYAMRHRKRN